MFLIIASALTKGLGGAMGFPGTGKSLLDGKSRLHVRLPDNLTGSAPEAQASPTPTRAQSCCLQTWD